MSHFATPFIVVNLGCEMLYVLDQRLKAQEIDGDKSEKVLTDIASILFHSKLLDELFLPQPVATQGVIKQLFQDISSTSIMKLDDYSMNKLWDLMTMILKWQLSVATNQNIFNITRRHLLNVTKLMPQNFPKQIMEEVMKKFEILYQRFSDNDYKSLTNTLILWFSEYHMKISVLIRLELQRKDGTFNLPSTIDPKILNNLGENIYKYDGKKKSIQDYENRCTDTTEINCLLAPIEKNPSKYFEIKLPISFGNHEQKQKTLKLNRDQFAIIQTNILRNIAKNDLTFNPNIPKSPQEDLLQMMDSN